MVMLSKRDIFACEALKGIIINSLDQQSPGTRKRNVKEAFDYADLMIKESLSRETGTIDSPKLINANVPAKKQRKLILRV